MVMLRDIRSMKVTKRIRAYVFRISYEKTERSKFFGSIGDLRNVWFSNADMCWRCCREMKKTNAIHLKWLTPGDNGWECGIKEHPKPSYGTAQYWYECGISKKEYKELMENANLEGIDMSRIRIRDA